MEVEKSQQMAEDIVSTANGVRNLRVDEPEDEDIRFVRARSGYTEGSRNKNSIDMKESSETSFFSRGEDLVNRTITSEKVPDSEDVLF